jgi:hypothetical protein
LASSHVPDKDGPRSPAPLRVSDKCRGSRVGAAASRLLQAGEPQLADPLASTARVRASEKNVRPGRWKRPRQTWWPPVISRRSTMLSLPIAGTTSGGPWRVADTFASERSTQTASKTVCGMSTR